MKNSYLSLKVVHIVLLVVALVSNFYSVINAGADTSIYGTSTLIGFVKMANILAIVSSFIYLVFGYKKNAAIYYKITMGALTLAQSLNVMDIMSTTIVPLYNSLLIVSSLIIMVVLATAKDFGEKNSSLLVLLLVALRIASVGIAAYYLPRMASEKFTVLINAVTNLIFAGTVGIMVMAKYDDKAERGSK